VVHKMFWCENPSGKRPLGNPRRRWEDNIRIDFQEIELWAWSRLISLMTEAVDGLF